MKLIDLISLFDENKYVNVHNADGDLLCMYNGRDSVDDRYNGCEVIAISVWGHTLIVTIAE